MLSAVEATRVRPSGESARFRPAVIPSGWFGRVENENCTAADVSAAQSPDVSAAQSPDGAWYTKPLNVVLAAGAAYAGYRVIKAATRRKAG